MYLLIATVGVLTLAAALWGGWQLRGSGHHHDVSVLDSFTGTVTIVNDTGTSGCIQPASGTKVCSDFVLFHGQAVHEGESVHAAHETFIDNSGNGYDWLLIVPTHPPQ